jgi:hypothetical protein
MHKSSIKEKELFKHGILLSLTRPDNLSLIGEHIASAFLRDARAFGFSSRVVGPSDFEKLKKNYEI